MKRKAIAVLTVLALVVSMMVVTVTSVGAAPTLQSYEYTLNADFDEGVLNGVEYDSVPDQLQLSEELFALPFIWVANSAESTVSKIDTETGKELGRYRTGPRTGSGENPSRTTVDINGDLWVGNRFSNTATKIALNPTGDTNGDGVFKTSQDLNNDGNITGAELLPWGQDDAILLRIAVDSGPRALAIDASNNVWIGGYGRNMGYYDGQTGAKLKNIYIGRLCYGALIDGNGTLWISNQGNGSLTRIDDPSGTHVVTTIPTGDGWVYGISIDAEGYIYTSAYTNSRLRKLDPTDNSWVYSEYSYPAYWAGRGVCVGLDGDVWVAQSGRATVTRHDASNGSVKATIPVGATPTGVAVAADGKIWVTNLGSSSVMRIDPATNTVDLTRTGHPGPYNYSDMTGVISGSITTKTGTWTVTYDSEVEGFIWDNVSWTDYVPADTSVTVKVKSSDGVWQDVSNGATLAIADGRYLEIEATLKLLGGEESPILYDLTVTGYPPNEPPDTSGAVPSTMCIWPPNHKLVDINILGVTDPDGDDVTITITGITSDEPTASDKGSGGPKHAPDAYGVGTDTAQVRAERSGKGDGRVYVISFIADDGKGGVSEDSVSVSVPHDKSGKTCPAIDSGQNYDATAIN